MSEDKISYTDLMTNADTSATFVLVPEDAPTAYWDGWATACGGQTLDGRRYTIVATRRTGKTGRSDAQYIIDRMASGLHFAKLQPAGIHPVPNKSHPKIFFDGGPTPAEVHDAAPEARGLVAEDENLPDDILSAEDYNEDGEIQAVPAWMLP